MELVGTTGTDAASSDVAKCLSSVRFDVSNVDGDGACRVAITSTAAAGNFIDGLWQPTSVAPLAYQQYQECPTSRDAVIITPGAGALNAAFSNYVYGAGKAISSTLDFSAGKVTVTAGGATFAYAITEKTGLTAAQADLGAPTNADLAVIASTTGLAAGQFKASIATKCDAGRYGLVVRNTIKLW